MVMRIAVALLLLVACKPSRTEIRAALASDDGGCSCPCTCADAAVPVDATPDATPDAPPIDADPPPPIDLTAPWIRTIITPGAATGLYRGADGVAEDAEHCWVTAWEEGGIVTRACPIGETWTTELVASGVPGVEDCKAARIDGDDAIDVVCASDSGQAVYVIFRGAENIVTTLSASMGHGHAMQVAVLPSGDIAFGTRIGAAIVGILHKPAAGFERVGSMWTLETVSAAGWVMSLEQVAGRLVVSDRAKLADGTWGLYGARWMEFTGGAWVAHAISAPAGSCSPYTSPTCTKTPGDEMMLRVVGNDVYDCTSAATQPDSRISIHRTTDWLSWTHVTLPPVANVGHCQGLLVFDVDLDGDDDIIVTTWKGNAYPVPPADAGKSGVYWLRNDVGVYVRGEISGPEGGKFDNAERLGAQCIITSEQLDPAGGYGVLRYCPPGVPP